MLGELGLGLLAGACAAAAFWRGDSRERLGGLVVLLLSAASILLPADPRAGAVEWGMLAADLAALVLLGRIAWKAPRAWSIWIMAPQAVAVAASLAFALQPDVGPQTYLRALLLARYAAALILFAGTWRRPLAHP